MSEYQLIEGDDHVVAIEESNARVPGGSGKMFTIREFVSLYLNHLVSQNMHWFRTGVRCRLLQLGSDKWVLGTVKIRLKLEFYFKPDDPPSVTPLLDPRDK